MKLPRQTMLMVWLLIAPALAADDEIGELIDEARKVSVTASTGRAAELIDHLVERIEQATPRQRATIRLLQARSLAVRGEPERGLRNLRELLSDNVDIDPDQRLHALRLAANISLNIGRFEQGFSDLNAALALVPEVDDAGEKAAILSFASWFHATAGNPEKAVELGLQSLESAHRTDDPRELCGAFNRLTIAYRHAGRIEEGLDTASTALDYCLEATDPIYIASTELELGQLSLDRGELERAERWIRAGLEGARDTQWAPGVRTGRSILAQLHIAREEWEQALDVLETLIPEYSHRELWHDLARAHHMAATIHMEQGDFKTATQHLLGYRDASKRFLDQDRARHLTMLEVELDTQLKEQELALLREQARVRELETQTRRQRQQLRYVGYGVTGFLIVVLTLLLIYATRERRHYRSLAHHDGLTGLNNHTRFFALARPMFEAALAEGNEFVLILADIDHFKRINDEHGHLFGDEVLRRVSARLRECFDDIARIGRIGGEEFAMAVTGHATEEIPRRLERLRESLRMARWSDTPAKVSMSFGIARARRNETLTALRNRADEALYRAKRAGRDRVIFADDPDGEPDASGPIETNEPENP